MIPQINSAASLTTSTTEEIRSQIVSIAALISSWWASSRSLALSYSSQIAGVRLSQIITFIFSRWAVIFACLSAKVSAIGQACSSSTFHWETTSLMRACFLSAAVSCSTVFQRDAAYFSWASVWFTTIQRLSRIIADHLHNQVTISSRASFIVLHIAWPLSLAISIKVVISSALETTQSEYALFAASINHISDTVQAEAFLIAASISSEAIPAVSESLSKLFLIGSISAAAWIDACPILTIPATIAAVVIFHNIHLIEERAFEAVSFVLLTDPWSSLIWFWSFVISWLAWFWASMTSCILYSVSFIFYLFLGNEDCFCFAFCSALFDSMNSCCLSSIRKL